MSNKKDSNPFLKKYWVSSIGVFLLTQLLFFTLETMGWIPNVKDMDRTLFGRIAES